MSNKKQIQRISEMEERFDRASAAMKLFSSELDKFETMLEDVLMLDKYYGSGNWWQDKTDDEAGRLPADLKRGVLSEDAIWDLFVECGQLNDQIMSAIEWKIERTRSEEGVTEEE